MSTTEATSLEQRIARLEDRAAISELRARFCVYTDEQRWDDLVALFTADGVLDVRGEVKGREAIRDAVGHLPELWESWWHTVDTEITEIDDDSATGIAYFDAPFVAEGESFNAIGRYDDSFARDDGEWRFSRRVLSFAVSAPLSAGWNGELPEGIHRAPGR